MGTSLSRRRRWSALWPGTLTVALALTGCSSTSDPGSAPGSTSAPPTLSSAEDVASLAAASDDFLERTLADDEPGCSASVGIEGEVVWAGARGVADLSTGRRLETTTSFDIASVSKQFTATAVLLLALDDRLTLDDPVARWVPGLPAWSREVTVEHLMHHTSGIPDFIAPLIAGGSALTDRVTQRDTLDAIASMTPTDPPGTRIAYSNSGYVLLAEVVREASGRSLPEFAREHIFERLGLDMAFDPAGASPDNDDESAARGYARDGAGAEWEPAGARWEMVGPGFVQTTPSELVRWADNYRTGELGGDELLDAQLADPVDAGRDEYAAGILIGPGGELWHDGDWAGFLSTLVVSDDRRTALAVSCNGNSGASSDIVYLVRVLRSTWLP
jgi:CubicO group peptidase (beta-lactamase class C family)